MRETVTCYSLSRNLESSEKKQFPLDFLATPSLGNAKKVFVLFLLVSSAERRDAEVEAGQAFIANRNSLKGGQRRVDQ